MSAQLDRIERVQGQILQQMKLLNSRFKTNLIQGEIAMGMAQDILDAVTAETTAVDSLIAWVNGLVESNVVSSEQGAAIIAAANANRAKLEAAMTTNVPTEPPVA